MDRGLLWSLGGLAVAGAGLATWYFLTRVPAAASGDATGEDMTSNTDSAGWPYARGAQYQALFDAATRRYGLPAGLLARQGYQESRFRDDIISGATVSSAGAVGIMQIIPRFHPEIDPGDAAADRRAALDPARAIDYAGKYLSLLYRQFGSWSQALAAYNWGPANVARTTNTTLWPLETRNYVSQITADVQVA